MRGFLLFVYWREKNRKIRKIHLHFDRSNVIPFHSSKPNFKKRTNANKNDHFRFYRKISIYRVTNLLAVIQLILHIEIKWREKPNLGE